MKRKIKSAKGFTLAELLIVVAIIAVLVAIGIPIFTSQLEKSREAVDLSDVRSAYAEVMMAAITGDTTAIYTKDASQTIYNQNENVYSITVKPLKQKQDGWQTALPITIGGVSSTDNVHWVGTPGANGECVITYIPPVGASDEAVKFEWKGGTGEDNSGTGGNGGGISGGDNGGTDVDDGSEENANIITDWSSAVKKWGSSNWPEKPSNGAIYAISANYGQIIYHEGEYYIVANPQGYNAEVGRDGWYHTPDKANGELQHITPQNIHKWTNNVGGNVNNLTAGDVYIAQSGDVYIFKGGGTNTSMEAPNNGYNWNWVKVEKSQTQIWHSSDK